MEFTDADFRPESGQGRIVETLNSRVSTFPISDNTTSAVSISELGSGALKNSESPGFLDEQATRTKECGMPAQPTRINDECCDKKPEAFNPKSCDQTRDGNNVVTSPLGQHMAETEGSIIKSLPRRAQVESDENCVPVGEQLARHEYCDTGLPESVGDQSGDDDDSSKSRKLLGKYFFYDPPLAEETGVWIPVSVPPMSESEHEEWSRGFSSVGGIFPDGDMEWLNFLEKDKELTMWDVVVEMLLAARGKVNSLASGDNVSWISRHLIDQAWKEMAQTLTEANFGNVQEILETEPPKWLPDSSAAACMLCNVRFHPIMCTRHHCRFCGGIFCSECTKGRSLLPVKFRTADTERVCDVCFVRLEAVQPYLMDQVSRASQLPTHDLTDLSTLRSWLNFPWGQSMEYEIYKATNTIQGYSKVGSLRPEKSIPDVILRHAKGFAILTIVKVGMMVTYNIGTGLVIARREDGSWSPPSAISTIGVGWGAQGGGEFADLIIVLRSEEAVKTFSSDVHVSFGAGLSAAIGIVGRTAEADVRAGTGGYATCYTYSCTKGAFIGCSLEGSVVTTRTHENSRFYGKQSISAPEILLGSLPKPPAAATLYRALADIYQKFEV